MSGHNLPNIIFFIPLMAAAAGEIGVDRIISEIYCLFSEAVA